MKVVQSKMTRKVIKKEYSNETSVMIKEDIVTFNGFKEN